MKAAQEANDREELLSAVRINWRLWTIIQAELLDPQCLVPMDVRTNVLSLAQFVDRHSVEVIGKPEAAQLDILISINRELAGGLYTNPQSFPLDPDTSNSTPHETPERPMAEQVVRTTSATADKLSDAASVRIST